MNHAVAQRLTRFAEDVARTERKVDEVLALLRPLTTPAVRITTPDGGRITVDPANVEPRIAPPGWANGHDPTSRGVVRALHAFGHIAGDADTAEEAVRHALHIERSRRDEAINEAREARAERDDLAAKLDKALDEIALWQGRAEALRVHIGGVSWLDGGIVMPGSPERRRWWRRRRR